MFFGDNGRNNSFNLEQAFDGYPTRLKFGQSYKSNDKPFIENKHSRIKYFAKEFLPGAVKEKMKKRGKRDPKLDAALTLPELEALIAETIIEFNKLSIKGYVRTPDMIDQNIKPCPNELFKYGVDNGLSEFIPISGEELEILKNRLLPRKKDDFVLHRNGIHYNHFVYVAENDADADLWQDHIGDKVQIRRNPLDCTYIWFELEGKTVRFVLRDDYADYRGYSEEEIKWLREQGKVSEAEFAKEDNEINANLQYTYEQTASGAKKKKAPSIKSQTAQISGIRDARKEEINRMQKEEIGKEQTPVKTEPLTPVTNEEIDSGFDEDEDFYDLVDSFVQEDLEGEYDD